MVSWKVVYTPQAVKDAAKLAQSAGDPRPTEALITEVGGVQPGDVGALKKLEARVTGDIKKFVVQNGADKDLDAAIKKLQETLETMVTVVVNHAEGGGVPVPNDVGVEPANRGAE